MLINELFFFVSLIRTLTLIIIIIIIIMIIIIIIIIIIKTFINESAY